MKKTYMILACMMMLTCTITAQRKVPNVKKKAVAELAKPVALPATNITATSFRSNWQPVEGAEGYSVQVFNRTVVPADGEYTVLDEDFSGITEGSLIEPLGGDEDYVNLDDYDYADNAGWSAYGFPNFVPSMVAGLIYSPYLNLTNNDGKYKVIITTYSNNGDQIRVTSHGKGEPIVVNYNVVIPSGGTGLYTKELEFDNGVEDLFFSVINNTAEVGTADYTDRIQVVQTLKKGDVYEKLVAIDESIPATYDDGFTEDIPVTYKTFVNVTKYAEGATTLYYNVAAGAYNFGYDENGTFTYSYSQSPYSDYIKVDLESKTSEVDNGNNDDDDDDDNTEPGTPDEPVVNNGVLTLGAYAPGTEGEETYDGFNTQNSPILFTYCNSGSQTIYLPSQLQSMKDKQIKSVSFCYFPGYAYWTTDYVSTLTLYLSEVDDEKFYTNPETGYDEWFNIDGLKPVATKLLDINFQDQTVNYEDVELKIELDQPYTYTGKTLLVTVTNESPSYIDSNDLVQFYWVPGQKGDNDRTTVFGSDSMDFLTNLKQNNRITATENEYQWREAPAVQFEFEDEGGLVDNIQKLSLGFEASNDNAPYFTITGVQVKNPTKGIYIQNGKKVVLK